MNQNGTGLPRTNLGAKRKYTNDFQVTTGNYFPFQFCVQPNYLRVRVGKKMAFSKMQVPRGQWKMGLMRSEGVKTKKRPGLLGAEQGLGVRGVRVPGRSTKMTRLDPRPKQERGWL